MINVNGLNPQTVKALSGLKEARNKKLLTFLQDELEGAKKKLVHASEIGLIHRLQGRAEVFEDLLKAIDESQKVVRAR